MGQGRSASSIPALARQRMRWRSRLFLRITERSVRHASHWRLMMFQALPLTAVCGMGDTVPEREDKGRSSPLSALSGHQHCSVL
jgi:hypothetical protein